MESSTLLFFHFFTNILKSPNISLRLQSQNSTGLSQDLTRELEEATEYPPVQFAGDSKLEGRLLMSLRAGLLPREPCRNGPRGTTSNPARTGTKFCAWDGRTHHRLCGKEPGNPGGR